jgi:transposase-like protein
MPDTVDEDSVKDELIASMKRELLYLALRNISKKWTMPIRLWKQDLNQFVILFPGRLVED